MKTQRNMATFDCDETVTVISSSESVKTVTGVSDVRCAADDKTEVSPGQETNQLQSKLLFFKMTPVQVNQSSDPSHAGNVNARNCTKQFKRTTYQD